MERKYEQISSVLENIVEGAVITVGLNGIYFSLSSGKLDIGSAYMGVSGLLLAGGVVFCKLYEKYKQL